MYLCQMYERGEDKLGMRFLQTGRAISTIPPKVKGTRNSIFPAALVLYTCPENMGSLESHLLFPAGITGDDFIPNFLEGREQVSRFKTWKRVVIPQ